MIYALDSNIISGILKDNETVCSKHDSVLQRRIPCIIPIMVHYEVLRGLEANDAKKQLGIFQEFCETVLIPELTLDDTVAAAKIYAYRKNRGLPVGDADILIAAQCVARGYTLVTNNTKHFEGIDDLLLEDWTKDEDTAT